MGGILLPDGITNHDVSQEVHPGQLIHYEQVTITGDFVNNTTNSWATVTGGTSGSLVISYTPPVDSYVVAHASIGFSSGGSVNQIFGRIQETGAPSTVTESGIYYPTASKSDSITMIGVQELTRDTAYTFEVHTYHTGSSLTVQEEDQRTHLECEFYASIENS